MGKRWVPALIAGSAVALLGLLAAAHLSAQTLGFAVPLSGREEVPVRATPASGSAFFVVSEDGSRIFYRLFARDIRNVTAAHIHLGGPGVNGGVVVFLFGPQMPGSGLRSGLLAEGVITADNLINALGGRPLSDLIAAMQSGNAYVNVHTNDGVAPTNTGPGDFPGGEIRGQIGRAPRRPRIQ